MCLFSLSACSVSHPPLTQRGDGGVLDASEDSDLPDVSDDGPLEDVAPDVPVDAPDDVSIDAPIDAPDDVSVDAPVDAPEDSTVDAPDGRVCTALDMTCDGVDDDCDEGIDEDYPTAPCTTGADDFCMGVRVCEEGMVFCRPNSPAPTDGCDGNDNDCDGRIDEDFDASCTTACGAGTRTCSELSETACVSPSEPDADDCGDGDEDCDGEVDEDFDGNCSIGVCSGIRTCSDGSASSCVLAGPSPFLEQCADGLDNDCDGDTDESECCFYFGPDGDADRYIWCGTARTHVNAEASCASVGRHLATVESEAEHVFLRDVFTRFETPDTWIGYYEDTSGGWQWTSGSDTEFTRWGETPNASRPRAARMRDGGSNYTWFDQRRSATRPYVCE